MTLRPGCTISTLAVWLAACGPQTVPTSNTDTDDGNSGTVGPATSDTADSTADGPMGDPYEGMPFGSGTRLRARYLEAPGGGQHLRNFYDTELDIDCVFAQTEAGDLRCLPYASAYPGTVLNDSGFTFFGDDTCSTPAVNTQSALGAGGLADVGVGDWITGRINAQPCAGQRELARPLRIVAPVDNGYRFDDDGVCTLATNTFGTLFSVEPTDVEVFAHADVYDEHAVRRLVSDDGAWQNLFMLDAQGRPCGAIGSESVRCLPLPFALQVYWADCHLGDDLSCSSGIAGAFFPDASCPESPAYALRTVDQRLDYEDSMLRLGNAGHSISCVVKGECMDSDYLGFNETNFFEVLETVPIAVLEPMQEIEHGEGPVRARYLGPTANAPTVPDDSSGRRERRWWDERYDQRCLPRTYADQVWCQPEAIPTKSGLNYFADDSCSSPVFDASDPTELLILEGNARRDPVPGTDVEFRQAVPWEGPVYLASGAPGCIEATPVADYYFGAGKPVDPELFMSRLNVLTQ